jgi:hypothetical protein
VRSRPARVVFLAAGLTLLAAAAIAVNVLLLGFANQEPGPAGKLTPRATIPQTTTSTPNAPATTDAGTETLEPDD